MAADVVDEVEADASRARVVEVAVEAEGAQVARKLLRQERRGDAAARVAVPVRAEEHDIVVRTGVGSEPVAFYAGTGGSGVLRQLCWWWCLWLLVEGESGNSFVEGVNGGG